jgi:rhodanese-related sulfurtransferase
MKKTIFAALLLSALLLAGCTRGAVTTGESPSKMQDESPFSSGSIEESTNGSVSPEEPTPSITPSDKGEPMTYTKISQQEAKAIMDGSAPFIVLDVREQSEYLEGHIPGAILLPHEKVSELAGQLLPDKDALILVYCRSGRRSEIASQALADLGYSNVKEFGGIIDWKYEIVK